MNSYEKETVGSANFNVSLFSFRNVSNVFYEERLNIRHFYL